MTGQANGIDAPRSLTSVPLLVTADAVRARHGGRADALLVDRGSIAAIGFHRELDAPGLQRIDFPGSTIVPGLRDAHIHPVGHAAVLARPSLKSAPDLAAVADLLRDAAAAAPAGSAITALRLDDETLAEGRLPDRSFLDAVVPENPTLLIRYCGHVAVASSAALDAAGIGPGTPDPPGGVVDRDADGSPTGVLRETAVEPVTAALAALAPPLDPGSIAESVNSLAAVGITGLGGIVSTRPGLWGGGAGELDLLLSAADRISIPVGVLVVAATTDELERAARRLDSAGGMLRFLGVKTFSDGSLGGHTAALREPYADRPDRTGTDRLDGVAAARVARAALGLGGRVAIHAIGDAANGRVLDLFEELIESGADPGMLRVEHASVLSPGDVARMAALGVTAVVQPAFLSSEHEWLVDRLGPDRLSWTYPFRTLIDSGVPIAGSSDCPVEPPSPLHGMAAARHRAGVVPAEALTGTEALALFTDWSAAAIGDEATLRVGAPATFTVLDRDPVTSDPEDLGRGRAVATWVEGIRARWDPEAVVWRE